MSLSNLHQQRLYQERLYQQLLADISEDFSALPDKPEETSESILAALWSLASGQAISAEKARDYAVTDLNEQQTQALKHYISQWKQGTPLAHISGRQSFYSLELLASPAALVPRKETELLAQAAISKTPAEAGLVLDICTGCGNLSLAIAHHRPNTTVYGADLSTDAVALAKENARFTNLSQRVEFFSGDLFAPFEAQNLANRADIITCNPPYISSKKVPEMAKEIAEHEPSLAFDGGPFGISILQRVIKSAPQYLKPGGWLLFEVGLGQGPALVKKLEKSNDYSTVESFCDHDDQIRVIAAQKTRLSS